MNPKVDFYFNKASKWQQALEQLRSIVLDCQLAEDLKWGVPCYSFEQNNVVLIHAFKNYCALLFHKGVLLHDSHGILIQQTEHVQAARQIRFTSLQEIVDLTPIIKAYIFESIEVEKAGLQVEYKKTEAFPVPLEFQQKLNEFPALKTAFEALTPGRQRGYLLYFSQAKQAKTRVSRIEKYMEQILDGRGLKDER